MLDKLNEKEYHNMQRQVLGSSFMTVVEMLNQAMLAKGMKKKDVAAQMGWSSQNFSNRMKNGTIDAEEWVKISNILGYEIQMVDLSSNLVLKQRQKSTGPRVVQLVDGIQFDTDKSTSLCHTPKIYGGWFELFKDICTGEFFTVAYFETGNSACLARITPENAKQFYLNCGGEEDSGYFNI